MESKTDDSHNRKAADNRGVLDDDEDDDVTDILTSSNRVGNNRVSEIKHFKAMAVHTDPNLRTFEFQRATHVGQMAVGRNDWDGSEAIKAESDTNGKLEEAKETADDAVVAPHMADPLPRSRTDCDDKGGESDSKGRSNSDDGDKFGRSGDKK